MVVSDLFLRRSRVPRWRSRGAVPVDTTDVLACANRAGKGVRFGATPLVTREVGPSENRSISAVIAAAAAPAVLKRAAK
jgi:hypothetical protein